MDKKMFIPKSLYNILLNSAIVLHIYKNLALAFSYSKNSD